MPHEVIMPALGMAQDTGVIVAWHKAAGDKIAADDVLFEVETDKATMEVPAGADGFVTHIRAEAGAEVPVGDVIALIGKTAEAADQDPAPRPASEGLPMGQAVIMPALGMAQDSGLIVAWHKAPGDKVAASDILFEVETDKSTMEVEAGHDGYVAALLAEAGQEAPVGETIAVISAEQPDASVQKSRSATPQPKAKTASTPEEPPAPKKTAPAAKAPLVRGGRVLASPKARRLALEQGLDLTLLVETGHPQPFHAADLEVLKSLPSKTAAPAQAAARRLTAEIPEDGFAPFATWAADSAELGDSTALLAGLAAAALTKDSATVAVETLGAARVYTAPAGPLGKVTEADPDTAPDLLLRDLRMSRVSGIDLGAEDMPVLTLTRSGTGLSITLECASHHLSATQAVTLLSEFAGRMEQPLRHLL